MSQGVDNRSSAGKSKLILGVLACGLIAAVLPGDAITMLLETLPLYILFEASVLLAAFAARREPRRADREASGPSGPGSVLY